MKNDLVSISRAFFNFFLEPAVLKPIVFLRISFGIFNLLLLINLYPYLHDMYGATGYIQWVFADFFIIENVPSLQLFYRYLPAVFQLNADEFVAILYTVQIVALVAITLGFFSNIFAFVCWALHLAFVNTGIIYGYGLEALIHVILFYFMFMPLDASFSVRNVLFNNRIARRNAYVHARLFLRVLQIHLCIVYLSAGTAKIFGEDWFNGEAVWRSLTQFPFNNFKPTFLHQFPWLLTLSGLAVVALETLYCIFIWSRKTRKFYLGAIIFMHLTIGLIIGLHFFATFMIIINLAAFAFNLQLTNQSTLTSLGDEKHSSL